MIQISLGQCAELTGGTLHGVSPDLTFTGVTIDSRNVKLAELFVAIEGERFDGADFAEEAVANGAAAVLASREIAGVPLVLVPEGAIAALQALAKWYRTTLADARVIGITGSAGKTLTKDFVTKVLATKGLVAATTKSQNNEIGLPLTILNADDGVRFLVLEMGARHAGDIAKLVAIANPEISVVTNVGLAHVEIFGGIDATQQAKSEIVQQLKTDGFAVLNADDERVLAMKSATKAKVFTFGSSTGSDVQFKNVKVTQTGQTLFDLACKPVEVASVELNLAGHYLASNAAAAAAVGKICGVSLEATARALSGTLEVSPNRARVIEARGFIVIDDSYNANPEAMVAALEMLKAVAGNRRCVAVIGDMRELGDQTVKQHQLIGESLPKFNVSLLVAVGQAAKDYSLSAPQGVVTKWVPDSSAAFDVLVANLLPDDVVLVKASRAIGLDELVNRLVAADFEAVEPASKSVSRLTA